MLPAVDPTYTRSVPVETTADDLGLIFRGIDPVEGAIRSSGQQKIQRAVRAGNTS
jgi:hypothetical protein